MPRTPDLNRVVNGFQDSIDRILATWRDQEAHRGVLGVSTVQAASSAALTSIATSWEQFRSDWHKKAIARDATQYRIELVRRAKVSMEVSEPGRELVVALRDLGLDLEINLEKYPSLATVNRLRDVKDQNVSFRSKEESDRASTRDLTPTLAARALALTFADWQVLQVMIATRNAIAHGSPRSMTALHSVLALTARSGPADLRGLGRVSRRVSPSGIGAYLCASIPWDGGRSTRVLAIGGYVRDLGDKFRV